VVASKSLTVRSIYTYSVKGKFNKRDSSTEQLPKLITISSLVLRLIYLTPLPLPNLICGTAGKKA
jgi:hypothetical protein